MSYHDEPAAEPIETQRAKCTKCGRFFIRDLNDAWGTVNKETRCDPCARPWSMDNRDKRPGPAVILNPESILRNRERARKMLATGDVSTWPRGEDWVKVAS